MHTVDPSSVRRRRPFLFALRALQFAALAVLMTIAFAVGGVLSGVTAPPAASPPAAGAAPAAPPSGEAAANTLLLLFLAAALESAVLGYFILASAWRGWRLAGTIFLAFYGVGTVVAQLESIVYLPDRLPPGMIPRLFVMGAITAAIFSPLAVLILGKMKRTPASAALVEPRPSPENGPGSSPLRRRAAGWWVGTLAVLVVAYLVLYYGFGYFVAWKQPEVRAFYEGTDPGSFFAQMAAIWKATPWMFAFQALRAILWIVVALPAIRMLNASPGRVALATAFLFAVWSSMLILPNPFMPPPVRLAHLVETAASNFLFGMLAGSLLARPRPAIPAEAAAP